jgi:sugar O-acyltransferase (sialic acid O-acetyltransferase NeuD family)
MGNKSLVLIGGGGHCRAVIDVVEQENKYRIIGILDGELAAGTQILGYEVLGGDEQIISYATKADFLITVGQIKTSAIREKIALAVTAAGGQFATVISPRAYISKSAKLGPGTVAMHDVLVNSLAEIGAHAILNTRSLVEHDTQIGDFVHVSTGAILNGGCQIGGSTFIGSGAVLHQLVEIPAGTVVPAGAIIKRTYA